MAFGASGIPVLLDWRLRECDYGKRNGIQWPSCTPTGVTTWTGPIRAAKAGARPSRASGLFLDDLPLRWDGQRVLVIGHVATRWALDHFLGGVPLEDLIAEDFAWQEGWEYRLTSFPCTQNRPG